MPKKHVEISEMTDNIRWFYGTDGYQINSVSDARLCALEEFGFDEKKNKLVLYKADDSVGGLTILYTRDRNACISEQLKSSFLQNPFWYKEGWRQFPYALVRVKDLYIRGFMNADPKNFKFYGCNASMTWELSTRAYPVRE